MRRGAIPALGSHRVPSDLALYMLAQHGIRIRPTTLRTWNLRERKWPPDKPPRFTEQGYYVGWVDYLVKLRHPDTGCELTDCDMPATLLADNCARRPDPTLAA